MSKWYNKNENGRALYIFEEDDISVVLDTVAINMLSNNSIKCLVPASFSQMDTTRYIKFDISSRIPFRDFVTRPTNFNMVAQLLINMCTSLKDLRRYMIDTNSIMFNIDLMFIDISIPMLSFIINPVLGEQKGVDIREFIRNLLMRLQILDNSNLGYIINYLNSRNFTTDGFVKELTKLMSESDSHTAREDKSSGFENFVKSGSDAPKKQETVSQAKPVKTPVTPVSEVSIPQTANKSQPAAVAEKPSKVGLFGGLFGGHGEGKKKANPIKQMTESFAVPGKSASPSPVSGGFAIPGQSTSPSPASGDFAIPGKSASPSPASGGFAIPGAETPAVNNTPPVIQPATAEQPADHFEVGGGARQERNAEEDSDVTIMAGSGDPDSNAPKLIRVSTAEIIDIDKDTFNIGRDPKSLLDYVINDGRVSRRHATIVHKNNNYFIIDLGSKNHTYVNGNMLISNMETIINNGDKIRIAFEEFIFEV